MNVTVWNRLSARVEEERVFSEGTMRLLYGTRAGRLLTDGVLTRHAFCRLYGAIQDTARSARKIPGFVRDYGIRLEEFEAAGGFRSFNEFFARRFRPGAREFAPGDGFPAFCEGRWLAYPEVRGELALPIKGASINLAGLLGGPGRAAPFEGGPLWICRLAPIDYHRFHFPDDGRVTDSWRIGGRLFSVNPMAMRHRPEAYLANERVVTLLETARFGILAYVEVGAFCVGKIVQLHGERFVRGEEKGYFLFGGSTVIVAGTRGAWAPDADLLGQTALGRETLVRLGEKIGTAR